MRSLTSEYESVSVSYNYILGPQLKYETCKLKLWIVAQRLQLWETKFGDSAWYSLVHSQS